MSSLPKLGHNDESQVYCDLCGWSHAITSFEQAEALLQGHLSTSHGKRMEYAVEVDTGRVKETPK